MKLATGTQTPSGTPPTGPSQGDLRPRDDQDQTENRPDRERLTEQKHPVKERERGRQIVRKRCSLLSDVIDEPVVEHVSQRRTAETEHDHRQHRPCSGQLAGRGDKRCRKNQ